jgi:hypothetical protein
MIVVMMTKNKMKPMPPYLENVDMFPNAFVRLFELLSCNVSNIIKYKKPNTPMKTTKGIDVLKFFVMYSPGLIE